MANWWTLTAGIRRIGTAYDTPSDVVICVDADADLPRDHVCTVMGCGSLHVVLRISKPDGKSNDDQTR